MFKLNENYEADRRVLKCDYIYYLPAETATLKKLLTVKYILIYLEKVLLLLC